ncbi:hypothetical protein Gotur_023955 [Gossypium turneri]
MNKSLAIHAILIYFDSVTTPDNFKMFFFYSYGSQKSWYR